MKRFFIFAAAAVLCASLAGRAWAEGAPVIRVSSASARAGEEVGVTVSLENNPGIVGMTLKLDYDTERLELLSMAESGLSGLWQKASGVAWASDTGDTDYNGVFLTLNFRVRDASPEGAAKVGLVFSPGDICNNALEDVDFQVVDGAVQIRGQAQPAEESPVQGAQRGDEGAGSRTSAYSASATEKGASADARSTESPAGEESASESRAAGAQLRQSPTLSVLIACGFALTVLITALIVKACRKTKKPRHFSQRKR